MTTTDFALVSHWRIAAPRERVWEALKHPTEWPRWWPFVKAVDERDAGDVDGLGARYRFHYMAHQDDLVLFDGVLPMLGALKTRHHWLAVATGKSRRGLDDALRSS